jgi:hypothetical protein
MQHDYKRVKQTLERLKIWGYQGCLAGGYLRDVDAGKDPKDMDFFLINETLINIQGYKLDRVVGDEDTSSFLPVARGKRLDRYDGMEMREDVVVLYQRPDKETDFIATRNTCFGDLVGNFDISACQIIAKLEDNKVNVYATESYKRFVETGVPELFSPIKTSQGHIDRVAEKYGSVESIDKTDEVLVLYGELTEGGIKKL